MKKALCIVLPILLIITFVTVLAVISFNKKTGPTESDVILFFQENKNTLIQLKDQLKDGRFSSDYQVFIDNGKLYFLDVVLHDQEPVAISNSTLYDSVSKVCKGITKIRICFDQSGKFAMILSVVSLKDGVWYGVYFIEDESVNPPIPVDYYRELEDNWYFYYIGLV